MVGLYYLDKRLDEITAARQGAEEAQRLVELSKSSAKREVVEVSGSTGLAIALIALSIGGVIIYLFIPFPNFWAMAGGAGMVAIGCLLLLQALPSLGKPVLALSREGFKTPLTPLVPWAAVDGIHLRHYVMRHGEIYQLVFLIEALPKILGAFGLFHRITHMFRSKARRKQFEVRLTDKSQSPEFIEKVARSYWKARTGNDYGWNPAFTDEMNQSTREIDRMEKQMQADLKTLRETGKVPADLGNWQERMKTIDRGFEVEMKAARKRHNWMIVAAGVLVLLTLLRLFFKITK